MSFLQNILSKSEIIDDYRCLIPIHVRFLVALCILALALVLSVCIKFFHTEDIEIIDSEKEFDTSTIATVRLVSIPKDFTIRTQEDIMQAQKFSHLKPVRHTTAKPPVKSVKHSAWIWPNMEKTYEQAQTASPLSSDSVKYIHISEYISSSFQMNEEEKYIYHTTNNGDTLDTLAELYLHDTMRWIEIYNINSDNLTNKESIPGGMIFLIPKH